METNKKKTLILGLGNLLMGDEAIGVRSVENLKKEDFPEHVHILDGGTGGFHLLHLFNDYERFIMIDAALNDEPPGTVKVIKPKFASDFPKSLTSHDIGLRDLMQSAELLHELPEIDLIAVTILDCQSVNLSLSPKLQESIPEVHKIIFELIN